MLPANVSVITTTGSMPDYVPKTLAELYDYISGVCGCSRDRVKLAKHTCFLKCIDIQHITAWVAKDVQNYNLVQSVMVLMCLSLLDVKFPVERWIKQLEKEYQWDSECLDVIISDYRRWYRRDNPTKGEFTRVNRTRTYEYNNTERPGCSLL